MNKLNGIEIQHTIKLVARMNDGTRQTLNPELLQELEDSIRYITPLFWTNEYSGYVTIPDTEVEDVMEEWLLEHITY